jgi:hypothetical protein
MNSKQLKEGIKVEVISEKVKKYLSKHKNSGR